jgi:hypothetical protein
MNPVVNAFGLRAKLLPASPVVDLARLAKVGGMATIPTRLGDLGAVLAQTLPQVDRLHLFLHGHETIPDIARQPKIVAHLAPRSHPYRASGKFYGLLHEPAPCLYIGFDDDILYHRGHVDRLIRALRRYRGRAIVGIHGYRFRSGQATFRSQRRSYHFEQRLLLDRVVDVLGTGTIGFVSSQLPIDPPSWPYGDMDDLMFAIEAERRGLPRVAVARPKESISAIAVNQDDSLWRIAMNDSTRHTEQVRLLLALKQNPSGA